MEDGEVTEKQMLSNYKCVCLHLTCFPFTGVRAACAHLGEGHPGVRDP